MTTINTIIEEEKKEAYKKFREMTQYEVWCPRSYIDTLLTTAMQRAYEAGQREERANVQESFVAFCDAFIENGDNSIDLESLEEWRQHTLTPDKK